jgi:DMSO/TMAO reductase YedYZ molybdopterin-dependent catalytic subunit
MTLLTGLCALLLTQAPAPGGVAVERLPFDPAKLEGLTKAEVRVTEDGRVVTYSGVPLAGLLERRGKGTASMAGLRSLSDSVILVRGTDGYQAAVSAAAVAMDPKGERYLIALARDGKPLDPGFGPVRLIVPTDPKHARWVKDIATFRLVRLDGLPEH